MPLDAALLDYANFYVRFVGDRKFNRDNPVWLAYLAGLKDVLDPGEWTYRFYCRRQVPESFGN